MAIQSVPTKAAELSQKQIGVRSPSRSMLSITLDRYCEEVHGRDGRQDLEYALVAPLVHMPKCVCRSVLQERGCVLSACPGEGFVGREKLRLLAWSNVINPFSSHVSGRGGRSSGRTMQVQALAFGTKRDSEGERDDDMEGPSWQGPKGPMQRQTHASRGPRWNKQSYAACGSSREVKFHPESMIVVRDMVINE